MVSISEGQTTRTFELRQVLLPVCDCQLLCDRDYIDTALLVQSRFLDVLTVQPEEEAVASCCLNYRYGRDMNTRMQLLDRGTGQLLVSLWLSMRWLKSGDVHKVVKVGASPHLLHCYCNHKDNAKTRTHTGHKQLSERTPHYVVYNEGAWYLPWYKPQASGWRLDANRSAVSVVSLAFSRHSGREKPILAAEPGSVFSSLNLIQVVHLYGEQVARAVRSLSADGRSRVVLRTSYGNLVSKLVVICG